jgi:hypothetical protein
MYVFGVRSTTLSVTQQPTKRRAVGDQWRIGKDVEGIRCGLSAQPRYSFRRPEDNNANHHEE